MISKLINIYFIFSILSLFSQNKKQQQIEKNLQEAGSSLDELDDRKAFKLAYKSFELAKKINHKPYLAESCAYLAASSANMGLHKIALNYTNIGFKYCPDDEFYIISFLHTVDADVFFQLNMYKESLKSSHKSVNVLKNFKKDSNARSYILRNYQQLLRTHDLLKNKDSLTFYEKKEEELLFSLAESHFYDYYIDYYINTALRDIKQNDRQRAYSLLVKSYRTSCKYHKEELYSCYYGFGKYYNASDPKRALNYYLKSIDIIEKYKLRSEYTSTIYKDIASIYAFLNNDARHDEYLKKYIRNEEKEKDIRRKNMDVVLDIMLLRKEQLTNIELQRNVLLISSFATVFLILLAVYMVNKFKDRKEIYLHDLSEKKHKLLELEQKVNESFLEVVDYAKKNDPLFWVKFQESYPHFLNKMLILDPNLKVSELILCAYIYLGFSSKEIANYTFKSLRTIENKRYNLRKKLKLSNETDFTVWINQYVNGV